MPYNADLSVDEIRSKLSYEPDTGLFRWLVSPAKNVFAGTEAGSDKATRVSKEGKPVAYKYIRINGSEVPAARVAWVLAYGEWPTGKISFLDGDTLNLRIANLEQSRSLPTKFDHNDPEQRRLYLKEHRGTHERDWKDWDLKRRFGISLFQYGEMLVAQGGKCAICGSREAGTRDGKPKALAVDHCHRSGKVRGLLCESCNQGIGKLKEDPQILLAAVEYLRHHAAKQCDEPLRERENE